jgi:hypothetical protein
MTTMTPEHQATATAPSLANTLPAVPCVSQAITNYIHKARRCSWDALWEIFGPDVYTESRRKQFSLALADLVSRGKISVHQQYSDHLLVHRYYTPPDVMHTPDCAHAAPVRTPPAQNNTMKAPVWVPPVCSVHRQGALDYQRYASHGHRC